MMQPSLQRLSRMGAREIAWRSTAAARSAFDRLRFGVKPGRWSRRHLRPLLAAEPAMQMVRSALAADRWDDAHRELSRMLATAPRRFVIAPGERAAVAARIASAFPASAQDAAARAGRILDGDYDLLGYRGLR